MVSLFPKNKVVDQSFSYQVMLKGVHLMRKCKNCNRIYVYDPDKGHSKTVCNSCVVKGNRRRKRNKLIEYKGGKCQRCGYDRCKEALEFHHLDPKTKRFNISGNCSRSLKDLKKEADKCILVCANCHREIEYMDGG